MIHHIHPNEAWAKLKDEVNTKLIDVRTEAELRFVGFPDLISVKKGVYHIEWQIYPDMEANPKFQDFLLKNFPDLMQPLIFICRTGGRSTSAANVALRMGYQNCYNVQYGFEGDLNSNAQRGKINGWKASDLPWRQL